MKEFFKALNTEENRYQYIFLTFPGLSYEKVKTGVFDRPQIRQLIKDQNFITSYDSCREKSMGSQKLSGQWQGWKYKDVVETTLQNYHHFRPDGSKI